MSVFMLVPHCFDDCSFVISFEIRECETSNFVLFFFFKIVLATWGPLRVHTNFRMDFSISAKKCHWDFDRDCIESVDDFELYFLRFHM